MRFPWLIKLAALAAIIVLLLIALAAVEGVVHERERRQVEAEQGVAGSLAGAQTLLGPVLLRNCHETWVRFEGEGKERSKLNQRRDFTLTQWPRQLDVSSQVTLEPRYRGLFKVNGYLVQSTLLADWAETELPGPNRELAEANLSCDPAIVAVALSDARGLRSAVLTLDGSSRPVLPGSLLAGEPHGLHAVLPANAGGAPVHAEIKLALAGTASLAWVPVADETTVSARSDWPHPSFGGQFLPLTREVGATGFNARWQVSALATSAQQVLREGARSCGLHEGGEAAGAKAVCVDSFGVSFIDPVNGYVLSDRALKYGLLFIALTFVAVGLVEVMRRLRVHPVQYLLVGCALTVFFLLLTSLGEHLPFDIAYLGASLACTLLLGYYGSHVLGGWRAGSVFGGGIALLYGALFALLQLEQTALVLGSILLFTVLAVVMVATRRIDWYALAAQMR